jgi:hypothetical protein
VTARGRTAALPGARRACAAGTRKTPSIWPTTTVVGSGRTATSSGLRTAAIASESTTTPTIGSEGEPTPGGAIGSGEPRIRTMWTPAGQQPPLSGAEAISGDPEVRREPAQFADRWRRLAPGELRMPARRQGAPLLCMGSTSDGGMAWGRDEIRRVSGATELHVASTAANAAGAAQRCFPLRRFRGAS